MNGGLSPKTQACKAANFFDFALGGWAKYWLKGVDSRMWYAALIPKRPVHRLNAYYYRTLATSEAAGLFDLEGPTESSLAFLEELRKEITLAHHSHRPRSLTFLSGLDSTWRGASMGCQPEMEISRRTLHIWRCAYIMSLDCESRSCGDRNTVCESGTSSVDLLELHLAEVVADEGENGDGVCRLDFPSEALANCLPTHKEVENNGRDHVYQPKDLTLLDCISSWPCFDEVDCCLFYGGLGGILEQRLGECWSDLGVCFMDCCQWAWTWQKAALACKASSLQQILHITQREQREKDEEESEDEMQAIRRGSSVPRGICGVILRQLITWPETSGRGLATFASASACGGESVLDSLIDVLYELENLLSGHLSIKYKTTLGELLEYWVLETPSDTWLWVVMAEEPGNGNSGSGPATLDGNAYQGAEMLGKRKRLRDSEDGHRSDSAEMMITGSKRARSQLNRVFLACPFFKKDGIRFRSCFKFTFTKISHVKQHLRRVHHKPFYCSVCLEVFPNEQSQIAHSRERLCLARPVAEFEWVTRSQSEQLSRRSDPRLPEDQQWFAIFEILFPSHPHPRSPYVDYELATDLVIFWEFMRTQGPAIVCGYVGKDNASFLSAVRTGLDAIIDRWMSERPADNDALDDNGRGQLLLPLFSLISVAIWQLRMQNSCCDYSLDNQTMV